MKKSITNILMISFLSFVVSWSYGQRSHHSNQNNNHSNKHKKKKIVVTNYKPIRPYYYPRNKVIVVQKRSYRSFSVLPAGKKIVYCRGKKYHYHNGYYYSYYGNKYNIIPAPIGIRISILPLGYKQIFFSGIPYFYYRGTYYKEVNNVYETVAPSVGTIVPELPEDDVEKVMIDDKTYLEYDGVLYKEIPTETGLQYEVIGQLEK
jgi:hypothetical protein